MNMTMSKATVGDIFDTSSKFNRFWNDSRQMEDPFHQSLRNLRIMLHIFYGHRLPRSYGSIVDMGAIRTAKQKYSEVSVPRRDVGSITPATTPALTTVAAITPTTTPALTTVATITSTTTTTHTTTPALTTTPTATTVAATKAKKITPTRKQSILGWILNLLLIQN